MTAPSFNDRIRDAGARVQLSLLDRLLDDAPELERDRPLFAAEALQLLRRAVRRDLEALLNAKRRWRSWPKALGELGRSNLAFGVPDFTSGAMSDPAAREAFRAEIERLIQVFEPRLASVAVSLVHAENELSGTLHLRIEGLLHAEPAPEPVSFDTLIDATSAEIEVKGPALVG